MFRVTYKEIEMLNDLQLTGLLKRLLHLEADKHSLLRSSVHASLKIMVADGGEDGRMEWQGGVTRTEHCPSRLTLFQY